MSKKTKLGQGLLKGLKEMKKLEGKIRPMGKITSDLEVILEEIVDEHDLQIGEILSLVYNWLIVHRPDSREVYLDDSNPIFYYGPKENK